MATAGGTNRRTVSAAGANRTSPLSKEQGLPHPNGLILLDCLGSGSYATVYKGLRKCNRETVAVKCIERKRLTQSSAENLFTEIKVMKGLSHRHIVRMIDFEWNSEHIFIILEYCGGGDLSRFIKSRETLKETQARRFLRQLAYAMQFLRSKGIAHMDLKPQNLLLTAPPRPILKIADFGMAQLLKGEDHSMSFRGSPLYMAPEVMLGKEYDAKVDLWSTGVILYEILFGFAPFASETLEELHLKVVSDTLVEVPVVPEISLQCREILVGLLTRDPIERISFDEFFNHPYIDLDHMPSPDCLSKARELVKIATVKDSEGKVSSALNYYCQSLDYFIPALEYEENHDTRERLKEMLQQYIERAEYLKTIVKSQRPLLRNTEESKRKLLEEMTDETPELKEVRELAEKADKLEEHQLYMMALEVYKEAVAKLLPLVAAADNPERKKLLASEIQVYLQRGEELNVLIEKRVPTVPQRGERTLSATNSFKSTINENCHVQ